MTNLTFTMAADEPALRDALAQALAARRGATRDLDGLREALRRCDSVIAESQAMQLAAAGAAKDAARRRVLEPKGPSTAGVDVVRIREAPAVNLDHIAAERGAAQAVRAELEEEIAGAARAVEQAHERVHMAAMALMQAEVAAMASTLAAVEVEAQRIRTYLASYGALQVVPPGLDRIRPVTMPAQAQDLVRYPRLPHAEPSRDKVDAWRRAYFALFEDAQAPARPSGAAEPAR